MIRVGPKLSEALTEARRLVLGELGRPSARVWVRGPTGSGRTTLAAELEQALDKAVLVVLAGADDVDAPIHGLFQIASHIPEDDRTAVLREDATPFRQRVEQAVRALASNHRTLLLRIPSSWNVEALNRAAGGWPRARRVADLIDGILAVDEASIVLLSSHRFGEPKGRVSEVALRPLRVHASTLEEPAAPLYAAAARALKHKLMAKQLAWTPLQLRLSVGLVALGERVDSIVADLETLGQGDEPISSLGPLARRLVALLRGEQMVEIRDALRRLAQARFPLPRADALRLARVPPEHETLVLECVGFGDDTVRMNEYVRRAIVQSFGHAAALDAHQELAGHHRQRDGVLDPTKTESPDAMLNWLEKVHHLAHAGATMRADWQQQVFPSRDFYWDLAWSLSYEQERYEEAAAIYRIAIERFGEDSYSCHYMAYNLDRAGLEREEVERSYRVALELDPDMPWWNSRLITFLIGQARFGAARDEWFRALDRVDRERELVRRDPWLATQLHRWVVVAWLDAGEVELAREAFDEIPPEIAVREGSLRELKERLQDAEEARALGESVYPAGTPADARWMRPRVVPETSRRRKRRIGWYPGRVVRADEQGVAVVVAQPSEDPGQRRVFVREMSAAEWETAAPWCPARLASGFVEVGTYEGGETLILPIVGPAPLHEPPDGDRNLRYLRRWPGRT